jgi:radical SAM superfamily enzyme YgiQ (UPF0313 family)
MAGGLGFDGGDVTLLPPLELLYMATTLKNSGHSAEIIDASNTGEGAEELLARIASKEVDAVITTVSLPAMANDCKFMSMLRAASGKKLKLLVKTSLADQGLLKEILKRSKADLVIFGEADNAVCGIIDGSITDGCARLSASGALVLGKQLIVEDLDTLPLPDRSLIDNKIYKYPLLGQKIATVQTSRGCPFECYYYCPYALVQGRKYRFRSVANVIAEISDIVKRHAVKKILFRDATMTLKKDRTLELCSSLEKLKIEWWCESRVDCLGEELLEAMKRAGCLGVNLGVESGDDSLVESSKKGLDFGHLADIVSAAKRIGIRLHLLFMMGLPVETKGSFWKTYALIKKLKPESVGVTIVTPFPGTPLYADALKNGWIKDRDYAHYGSHYAVMKTAKLSRLRISAAYRLVSALIAWRTSKGLLVSAKKLAAEACLFLVTHF